MAAANLDQRVIESFGHEWASHDQSGLSPDEKEQIFEDYFRIFPWDALPAQAQGFDMGCGSGRWASVVAPRIGLLNCIDPAREALAVARRNLAGQENVVFHESTSDTTPLAPNSQDFGYSLGVLHHIPDTGRALADCTALLKPGAPFLLYLYYRFDNRPAWFRSLWKASELVRAKFSRLSPAIKNLATDLIATAVYFPLARMAAIAEKIGLDVRNFPLGYYRDKSFLTMRTDSRDRFGTSLEQRFTKEEIREMMEQNGLENIIFSDQAPFWVACGFYKNH